ncbi:MAG: FAD:protein FMN transferase [Candidatus Marinimicrobia bacterium]|nr:FAD:protein FMN transferase [Candidatus Neomarinimicrobiota bacterium]
MAERTDGAFDPTVAPLVNAWGFGFTEGASDVDSAMIDSILNYVNYKLVRLENHKIAKDKPGVMLDFNAIAQGYTVDVLADFLESKGIDNYLIELGGELKARGKNQDEKWWKIGIDKPVENINEREIEAVIELKNKALATSGSYRKFYVKDGIKYSHTIDPKTGYPVNHSLLSATVLANDCMTADAYATAFMVIGIEKANAFLKENKDLDLDVYFIYSTEEGLWKTYYSKDLEEVIVEKK